MKRTKIKSVAISRTRSEDNEIIIINSTGTIKNIVVEGTIMLLKDENNSIVRTINLAETLTVKVERE